MGVKAPIGSSHVGNSLTLKNFLANKGDLSIQVPTLSILPTHLAEVRLHQPLLRQQTPLWDHAAQIHQGHRGAWESRTSSSNIKVGVCCLWPCRSDLLEDARQARGQLPGDMQWVLALTKAGDVLSQQMDTDVITRLSPPPLGIVCLVCLGKKPTQNIFLGKKIKTAHKYLCHEAEKNFGSQLAYKRLQAPNQLSTWVYKKVKPLKKTMSSWSKRKGGNGVWEGRKIKFDPTWKRVGKRTCL